MTDEQPILLTDSAGAALLDISRATWWRRVNDKTLPAPIRIGGVTRWRRDEVMAVVAQASAERNRKAG